MSTGKKGECKETNDQAVSEKEECEKEWRESIEGKLDRIEDYIRLLISDIENVP